MSAESVRPQPLVSACLIVRDEEANLSRCLSSLKGLVDEIVAVDTGSVDNTVPILESFGARVLRTEWRNDFAFHRNQALELATGKWALVIDADEELIDTDIEETRWYLENEELPPVGMVHERILYPTGKAATFFLPRLIRCDSRIRYQFPVHEQLMWYTDPDATLTNVTLLHHGYASSEATSKKERRNLAIALGMGDSPHGLHCVARSTLALGEWQPTIDACSKLLDMAAPELLKLEASAMAGAACLEKGDISGVERFASCGARLMADAPDVLLLSVVSVCARYLRSLNDNGAASDEGIVRPWVFSHNPRTVCAAMALLLGQQRIASLAGLGAIPPLHGNNNRKEESGE